MKDMLGASLFFSVSTFGWPAAAVANVLHLEEKKQINFRIFLFYGCLLVGVTAAELRRLMLKDFLFGNNKTEKEVHCRDEFFSFIKLMVFYNVGNYRSR